MRRTDLAVLGVTAVLVAAWLLPRLLPRSVVSTGADITPEEQTVLAQMRQVLSKDDILPIYNPRFLPAAQVRLREDELVLGVAIGDQAKAYPITILNGREMVNDGLGGVPILVTW
jgi:hypothetical protein